MEKKNTDYINCDLSDLTLRQQTIIRMWIDGKNYREISEVFGCSKQNICATIKRIQKILDTPPDMRTKPAKKIAKPPKKRVKRAKKPDKHKLPPKDIKYKDYDFSILSEKERLSMEGHISGMTYKQLAEKLGVSPSYLGRLLHDARCKLDGIENEAVIRRRENMKRYCSTLDPEVLKERQRKAYLKNREHMLEYFKEYNKTHYPKNREEYLERQKAYYQKNREKILEKQRLRKKGIHDT